MELPIDYRQTLNTIFRKKAVRNSIILSAVLLNFSPLFLKDVVNRNAKLALSMAGLGFAIACSRLPKYEHEEKLRKTYEDTETKILKTQIVGHIQRASVREEINNKVELAAHIENLPKSFQTDYFAKEYAVTPLIAQYYIESSEDDEEDQQPIKDTVKVNSSVFDAQLDVRQGETESDISWLKKAVLESCFIAGKKNSGKSHLMKWLLSAWIETTTEKDLFYVIDKHLDPDEPWLKGLSDSVLRSRFFDGSNAIAQIKELHNTLLYRIQNKLTLAKTNSRVRVWIDEIDSYTPDELETVISPFIKDVENQGRKYGFTVVVGAHSIKKGEMGIDSSVTGSMLQVLFSSVVLDKNSVLSGAFPSLPIIRNEINKYKLDNKDCRVVCILEDGENFYVSHIPNLELPTFEVEKPEITPYDLIVTWCKDCKEKEGFYPSRDNLRHAWKKLTNHDLNDNGLQLLLAYLLKLGIEI
jgi:hypothetical protein